MLWFKKKEPKIEKRYMVLWIYFNEHCRYEFFEILLKPEKGEKIPDSFKKLGEWYLSSAKRYYPFEYDGGLLVLDRNNIHRIKIYISKRKEKKKG